MTHGTSFYMAAGAIAIVLGPPVSSGISSCFSKPAIKHERSEWQDGGDDARSRESFGDRHTPDGEQKNSGQADKQQAVK